MKFREGQRVRLISHDNDEIAYGETGTVRGVISLEPPIGVEWDTYNSRRHNLHHCSGGPCQLGHGWYVYDYDLEIIPTENTLNIEELI